MKKILCFILLLWQSFAFCQNSTSKTPVELINELYSLYGITITAPDGYNMIADNVGWKNNLEYKHTIGGLYHLIASCNDNQCLIMYSALFSKFIRHGENSSVDGYDGYIAREILQSTDRIDENFSLKSDKTSYFDPNKELTTITGKDIVEGFNANKICIYSIPVKDSMFFNSLSGNLSFNPTTYSNIVRVFILKEGGYHYDLLFLMTDEAFKHKDKYLGDIKGTIKFDEDKIKKTWIFDN